MPITSSAARPDLAVSGRARSGNIPARIRKASAQPVAKTAKYSEETQFGSIAAMALAFGASYSAGVAYPVGGGAMFGFGVREVLRMSVFTKRLS